MFKKFPFYRQSDSVECGPTCLKMIAEFYGQHFDLEYLKQLTSSTREGTSMHTLAEAAENLGMNTVVTRISLHSLQNEAPLPCIVHWRNSHFVVVFKSGKNKISVADPEIGILTYNDEEFLTGWTFGNTDKFAEIGYTLLLEPTQKFYETDEDRENKKESEGIVSIFLFLKKYKSYLIQLLIGLCAAGLVQLLIPIGTQAMVDYGIKLRNPSLLVFILIAQIVLVISFNIVEIIRNWLIFHISSRLNIMIISNFLMKMLRLPMQFFQDRAPGDIQQRINDNHRIEVFLSTETMNVIFASFSFFVLSVLLFYYSILIACIYWIATIIFFIWISLFVKKREVVDKLWFFEAARNNNFIFQIIFGIQEIRLNNSEQRRRWNWENARAKLFHASIRFLKVSQRQASGGRIINDLKNIVITFLTARSAMNGEITLGMMISIQYIIGQLHGPMSGMVYFLQAYQEAGISYRRFSEISRLKNENDSESPKMRDVDFNNKDIKFDNVIFEYKGREGIRVLNELEFTIPEGKITAIVGPSGGGKSSLLKVLMKLHDPKSGTIKLGDTDYKNIDNVVWRENIGVVMQDGFIFSDTIEQNISESRSHFHVDPERLKYAIEMANLTEFVNALPLGAKTKIGANEMELSGGEKQRVLIARAIYKDPKFLFFDEATSSLDTNNEKSIMEKLGHVFKNRTVLIIAHRLSTIKNADQILVLDKGKIIESGNHVSLINSKGAYYNLVQNQLQESN